MITIEYQSTDGVTGDAELASALTLHLCVIKEKQRGHELIRCCSVTKLGFGFLLLPQSHEWRVGAFTHGINMHLSTLEKPTRSLNKQLKVKIGINGSAL